MAYPAFLTRLFGTRATVEPRDPDVGRLPNIGRTLAGVYVTPDNAVQVSAVWACLRYLSQSVAMLPWNVMGYGETNGVRNDSVIQDKHPVQWLLHNRPNPEWSSFQFRETLTHWALRWGNGYAEIEPDMAGRPFALWPIHPERVEVCRDQDTGALFYEVNNGRGGKVRLEAAAMFHIRGFGEGPVGENVMSYAAQSIGWAKAMQLFGAAFFGNGANVGGFIQKKEGKFEPGPLARMKAEMDKLFKGVLRSNKLGYLDDGMTFTPTGIEPQKAQMVEANYLMVEEICRWFGVPPHKVAHLLRATFTNIEHQSIEVVQDSLMPWVRRFEDEADFKLFGQNRQGLYTKIELRGLLRGDFKTQQEGLEIQRRNGIVSAAEWRSLTDMGPMPEDSGADKYIVQGQMIPLDQVGEQASSMPAADPTTTSPADQVDQAGEAQALARLDQLGAEHAAAH